jgi:hypothetical protein
MLPRVGTGSYHIESEQAAASAASTACARFVASSLRWRDLIDADDAKARAIEVASGLALLRLRQTSL